MAQIKKLLAQMQADIVADSAKAAWTDQQWYDYYNTTVDIAVTDLPATEILKVTDLTELRSLSATDLTIFMAAIDREGFGLGAVKAVATAMGMTKTATAVQAARTKTGLRSEDLGLGQVLLGYVTRAKKKGGIV